MITSNKLKLRNNKKRAFHFQKMSIDTDEYRLEFATARERMINVVSEHGIALSKRHVGLWHDNLNVVEITEPNFQVFYECSAYVWMMYNFELSEIYSDEEVTPGSGVIKNGESQIFRYTSVRKSTPSDFPFWIVYENCLMWMNQLSEVGCRYCMLRDIKTTKLLPVQMLFPYLTVTFNLSGSILESLFWNSTLKNEHGNWSDGARLLWNIKPEPVI